jgi:lipopolysaccharide/colanic/teichoic acid biosynthesis glycosyltransferase
MFDVILVLLLAPVLIPVILVVTVVLLVIQGRPVFFRQVRVGENFKTFEIYKFRTMHNINKNDNLSFDAGNKSRVTRLGKILRKTKLDELPQIFNVIGGEMSFVGPRPEVPEWVDLFHDEWAPILSIKPGITDPASIEFRNEEDLLARADNPREYYAQVVLPKKLLLYREYLENKSLSLDLSILFKTIKKVLFS